MKKIRRVIETVQWYFVRRKLKKCGSETFMGHNFIINGTEYISIGDRLNASCNCEISAWKDNNGFGVPELIIGNDVTLAERCYISCSNKIVIGDGCLLGVNTFITDNYHGNNSEEQLDIPPDFRKIYSKGPVHVGRNVWIGRNACIMPNVKIGDYSIIGANAVVTHDIPEKAIVGGVPARIISYIGNVK